MDKLIFGKMIEPSITLQAASNVIHSSVYGGCMPETNEIFESITTDELFMRTNCNQNDFNLN